MHTVWSDPRDITLNRGELPLRIFGNIEPFQRVLALIFNYAAFSKGMGFCIFNNIAVAAHRARALGMQRIAIVDYDVHHGNGTQEAFWNDAETLFICLHQDGNYPSYVRT
jgi:hypothetical protein